MSCFSTKKKKMRTKRSIKKSFGGRFSFSNTISDKKFASIELLSTGENESGALFGLPLDVALIVEYYIHTSIVERVRKHSGRSSAILCLFVNVKRVRRSAIAIC